MSDPIERLQVRRLTRTHPGGIREEAGAWRGYRSSTCNSTQSDRRSSGSRA